MPATNYTPIQLYRSTTSGNIPNAANLSAGEIALNIADNDMTMYFENASGTVKSFFNNPAALKYPTADGTSGQIIQTNGAGVLSFGSAPSSALTNNTRQAVTSSATTTLNLNSGNVIDLTMAANITTLSFTNVPASGTPILIQVVVKNASDGTAYTIVWPSSVYWSGQYAATTISTVQTAPTLATGANGVTVIALLTTDGGTKWRGWVEATIPGGVANSLYSWGDNSSGLLGQNNATNTSSPIQVGSLSTWSDISLSSSGAFAINQAGQLFSWGNIANGQLGQNDAVNRSSPTQVGSLTNWSQLAEVNSASTGGAIKTDGTLWLWGRNQYGQLGVNNRVDQSSPVQVGALTNWSSIAISSLGCVAIKTDGTMWSWGDGFFGALGQNSITGRSSPVQIGALTTWSKVSVGGNGSNLAIKTDGTLWAWGYNTTQAAGALGLNDTVNRSSPVQVGALTTWSQVAADSNSSVAITTDGKLYAWGTGSFGRLGLNNETNYSSPVQVGALTTWSKARAGNASVAAIKTDGTLWVWGFGNSGALGLNDTVNRSSPVQVGALTTWGKAVIRDRTLAFISQTINPA